MRMQSLGGKDRHWKETKSSKFGHASGDVASEPNWQDFDRNQKMYECESDSGRKTKVMEFDRRLSRFVVRRLKHTRLQS